MVKLLLAGFVTGAFTMTMVMSYHLVRSDSGFSVVPRVHQAPFRSTYMDTREWSLEKTKAYPEFVEALVRAGKTEMLVQGAIPDSLKVDQPQPAIDNVAERTKNVIRSLVPINFKNTEEKATQQIDVPDPVLPPHAITSTQRSSDLGTTGVFPPQQQTTQQRQSVDQILSALGTGTSAFPGTRPIVQPSQSTIPNRADPTHADSRPQSTSSQPKESNSTTQLPSQVNQKINEVLPKEFHDLVPKIEQATPRSAPSTAEQPPATDWLRGFVNSLVADDGVVSESTDSAVPQIRPQQQGHSHPKVEIEAPDPGSMSVVPNIFQSHTPQAEQTDALPSYRAF